MPPPSRAGAPMSNAVQPFVSKPPSLEMVAHQVFACIQQRLLLHGFGITPHAPSALHVDGCQPPTQRLQQQSRLRRGGVGEQRHHRRQQERVQRGQTKLAQADMQRAACGSRGSRTDALPQYTEWCKNCLDESDFHMVGGGKFVVKVRRCARVFVRAFA